MPRIEEMYAFVTEDKGPGDEGVIGTDTPLGWMPFVGADMARIKSLRPLALQIAKNLGKEVKLLHFTKREELEILGG